MEQERRYLLIGGCVLVLGLMMAFSAIWLGKKKFDEQAANFTIQFLGSVNGLKVGSNVLYRGVPIGTVDSIRIAPENIEHINVVVALDPTVPIKEDMVASLEMQGITGLAYIQLTGGTNTARRLTPRAHTPWSTIPSKRSNFEMMFADVPMILNKIDQALTNLNGILAGSNAENIQEILQNVRDFTGTMTENSKHFNTLVGSMDQAIQSIQRTSDEVHGVVAENRPYVQNFASVGLYDLGRMIVEMNATVREVRRFIRHLESKADNIIPDRRGKEFVL